MWLWGTGILKLSRLCRKRLLFFALFHPPPRSSNPLSLKTAESPHENLFGIQWVSNPSTENQRISTPSHSNGWKSESTLVGSYNGTNKSQDWCRGRKPASKKILGWLTTVDSIFRDMNSLSLSLSLLASSCRLHLHTSCSSTFVLITLPQLCARDVDRGRLHHANHLRIFSQHRLISSRYNTL